MKIVVSVDSFKGSVSSMQAARAIEKAAIDVFPDVDVVKLPLADGGEGTVDALCDKKIKIDVTGPIGNKIKAEYGIAADGTAIIEMASAAGITLVPDNLRNPMYTTTYGVGELILDAIKRGSRNFIIGIGGSATNDCGIGMLSALGFKFLNSNCESVSLNASGLEYICKIDCSHVLRELSECTFNIACDVSNPLYGDNGCSRIYGPQKGANEVEIELMDSWIKSFAMLVKSIKSSSDPNFPGSGAAGGLGFAFMSFLNARLRPGVEIILEHTNLEKSLDGVDFVITGEGRLDSQSIMGKAPIGVARLAKKYNIPVIAFCGCVGDGVEMCNDNGIDAYFPILQKITNLEEALDVNNAVDNIYRTAKQVFLLLKTIKNV